VFSEFDTKAIAAASLA
jgi:aarF domain-containing kinase